MTNKGCIQRSMWKTKIKVFARYIKHSYRKRVKSQETPTSIYDQETEEEDLWFLPGPPEDMAPTDPPWRMARRGRGFDAREWRRAEAAQGRKLAQAAAAFAALDERFRGETSGQRRRLALMELAELSWADGTRLSVERIALHDMLRISTAGEDAQALENALWALKRLSGGPEPMDNLATFLGRKRVSADGLERIATRPVGDDFEQCADKWALLVSDMGDLHPLTRGAAGFHAWRMLGLSGDEGILESAVAAARIGASGARGGAVFVPIALGDVVMLGKGGTPNDALARWLNAVENACLRALLHLDRVEEWRLRAVKATRKMSGRTPPKLIEALGANPVLSAEMVAEGAGVSRAAARRNLGVFKRLGLVREVTGQDRYRFWTAVI